MSIVLVAGKLPEDSQFPTIERDLSEAAKYASLWATKDANRIRDNNIFWVFMEMNIRMGINHKTKLSTIVYNNLQDFSKFKVDLHKIYIRAREDPTNKCTKLPFIAETGITIEFLSLRGAKSI